MREPPASLQTPSAERLQPEDKPRIWPPSAEEVAASLPYDPSLGKFRIEKFFFKQTDVMSGPADPEIFVDELWIQLYDPDSDHKWWQSYSVATPKGLAEVLKSKSWKYVHAPDMLVLPRYDLEEIRRAAVARIVADHDYFKDTERPEEESL